MGIKKRLLLIIPSAILLLCLCAIPAFATTDGAGLSALPDPIDPQNWQMQRDMTWDQLKPNPVINWNEFDISETKTDDMKGLLVLLDFKDTKFIVSQPKGSDIYGNPVMDPIPYENLRQFWNDMLNVPQDLNHGLSIHNHWLETTGGRWNVTLKTIGPYTLPGYEFEYGIADPISGSIVDMPPGFSRRTVGNDAIPLIQAAGEVILDDYDFIFFLHAGYDESGTWQEFGEMKYTKDTVPREFGPLATFEKIGLENLPAEAVAWAKDRDEKGHNWAVSRYGNDPWTSWYSGTGIWPHKTSITVAGRRIEISIQGENGGMGTFSHEFGHIKGLTDNYNDQFILPVQRTNVGNWDIMATGNWAGPGGNHARWLIPTGDGASTPSLMGLRTKIYLGITSTDDIVDVSINDLRAGTPVVAEILARNIPVGEAFGIDGYTGLRINGMVDQKPSTPRATWEWWDADNWNGAQWYNGYTMEVVDRSGYDSFMADSGAMISKYRTQERRPTTWIVDAHPQDINVVDFTKADGETVYFPKGHVYQLNDALFHAGIDDDVVNEYVDEWNGLHFYILDRITTPGKYGDILSYKVGVRAFDATLGSNPPTGGMAVGGELNVTAGEVQAATPGKVAVVNFEIANTGDATDIVRVSFENGSDLDATLLNNLYAIEAGKSITVPLYIALPEDITAADLAELKLTLNASSETNAEKAGTASVDFAGLLAAYKVVFLGTDGETILGTVGVTDGGLVSKAQIPFVDLSYGNVLKGWLIQESGDLFDFTAPITQDYYLTPWIIDAILHIELNGSSFKAGEKIIFSAYFKDIMESNVAILDFSFDKDAFDYDSFTPADGVTFVSAEETDAGVRITVMVPDYNTSAYGGMNLVAIEDVQLGQRHRLGVRATYVTRQADGQKKVETAENSFAFIDPPDPDLEYNLINLSNMIDVFGMTSADPDWSKHKIYDLVPNGQIDINDVALFASKIGK